MASRIRYEDVGEVCVVHFADRNLTSEADLNRIGQELYKLVDEQGKRKLLLDYTSVERKSTAMLGIEVTLHTKLKKLGGKLVLSGVTELYMEAYRITKLDTILTIVKDEQTGLGSF